jgi:hypothetical protein
MLCAVAKRFKNNKIKIKHKMNPGLKEKYESV